MKRVPSNNFVMSSVGEDYPALLSYLEARGRKIPSRIGLTKNLQDVTITLLDPYRSLAGRKAMSDAFAVEESTQILAGRFDADRLRAIAPRAAELITPATAYGPRVWPQLYEVEHELLENPNTRRAVVYVGRPDDLLMSDDPDRASEMPCTCVWQFDRTDGRLNMYVYMRSNDAVWGFTYDVPSFTAVQRAVAAAVGAPVGVYRHHAGSFHLYERHFGLETWTRSDDLLDIDGILGDCLGATKINAKSAIGVGSAVIDSF